VWYNKEVVAGKLNKIVVKEILTEYLELGRGPVVMLLHGWGQSAAGLLSIAEPLSKKYRVVVPSLPGFGGSSEPKTAWTTTEYAAWVQEFMVATGLEPVATLGHSFGGQIMVQLFAGKKTTQKLIFVDAAGVRMRSTVKTALLTVAKWPVKWLKKSAKLRNYIVGKRGSEDYRAASAMMREVLKKTVNEDLSAKIPTITAKTLIIWGEEDATTPVGDAQVFAKIKGSQLEIIQRAKHFPFLDEPVRVNELIEGFIQ
jgi:pimeloyl-ACP methyl ester carboxylesterase